MKAEFWKDFRVIATSNGEKLEKWGDYTILRPDPQVIWKGKNLMTKDLDAHYIRTENKSGEWKMFRRLPDHWTVHWKDFTFYCKPMNFKHMGIFPEQAVNWDMLYSLIKSQNRELKVLNLFAYTGVASVVCAKAGAKVTHVDSAKSMVDIAKINCELNDVDSVRFIIDDCKKFIEKEIRRGNTYDIILMDPPSFGRGPNGEVWKIEDDIFDFVSLASKVMSKDKVMMLINSYTTGLQPTVMANILNAVFDEPSATAYELTLPTDDKNIELPCGCTAYIKF